MVFTNQTSHLDDNGEVKKLPTFLGETNDWGSGKNVRFGIEVVADAATVKALFEMSSFTTSTPTSRKRSLGLRRQA